MRKHLHIFDNYFILGVFILLFQSCDEQNISYQGSYELEVDGLKNTTKGLLELVGDTEDCFGKLTFFYGSRDRVYEIGLKEYSKDSLWFRLPGNAGFLKLDISTNQWSGSFKYFGLNGNLKANRTADVSEELEKLLPLKPLGKGTISTEMEESFPSFDAANDILYFTRESGLYASELKNNSWTESLRVFKDTLYNDSAPYIFNKGNSLLFTSNRKVSNKKDLYISNKNNGRWSSPNRLPYPVNIDSLGDYHAAISEKGSIFFVSYNQEGGYGRSDLYKAISKDDENYQVSNLGEAINSEKSEADVFIASDESYILFASTGRKDSFGADDIYISYKNGEGWSTPVNLGPKVNCYAYDYGAWVDEINGFLYFNSYRRGSSDIYKIPLSELEAFKQSYQ